jgi:RNA polymerase sigma-70 factor, ECF subfamily
MEGPSKAPEEEGVFAFDEIVRAHGATLRERALWLTKQECDAADLVQDTLERAMRAPHRVAGDQMLRWLLVIMHNLFLDRCRASSIRRHSALDAHLLETVAQVEPEEVPLWRTVDQEMLERCLQALPRDAQYVLLLFEEGKHYVEIGRQLGLPQNTVGTRLFRARRRLRSAIFAALGLEAADSSKSKRRSGWTRSGRSGGRPERSRARPRGNRTPPQKEGLRCH